MHTIKKKIVITNHTDKFVEWYDLFQKHGYTKEDITIYDRDHPGFNGENLDPKRLEKYGTVIKTRNVGTGIYVIGKYIVDNYENLPDYVIFLKCNLLQNGYTTKEIFEKSLDSNCFFRIESDVSCNKYATSFLVNDYIYIEEVKDIIYENTKIYPRIKNFPEFLKDLFIIDVVPNYVSFAPGGNYVVPKENILKYTKNFYKKMIYYTDYSNFETVTYGPTESHWFERVLDMSWIGNLKENMSYIVDDSDIND